MDLHNSLKITPAIAPQVETGNTAIVSAIIDRANYPDLEFAICTGTLSDADTTLTILVEDGNNSGLSDNAAVADSELLGTEAGQAITFADDGETRKIGYIGAKRYVRLTITPANNTGNIPIAAVAIQGGARKQPVA
jgi:hypothetical protein